MGFAARAAQSEPPAPYVIPPSQEFDGNDGSWSTFKISVGTPGQDFRVLPSTKGGVTYVIAPEGCLADIDPVDCPNKRGVGVFDSSQSSGFDVGISTTWSAIGQYEVDLEETLNYTAQGLFGFDRVSLGFAADGTSLSLPHQVVAGIADLDYFMGVLPLGLPEASFSSLSQSVDSLLYTLRNASKIPSLSYAYTAGARYRLKRVFGSLILGGYDSTRFQSHADRVSFTFSSDPSKLLTVGVQSIMAMNTLRGAFSLTSSAHISVLDSTIPHLWLPRAICDQFEAAFGLTYDATTDFYLVNDSIHDRLLAKNPTVTIKLANSLKHTATQYTNIQLPYAAFDLQATYPHYQNATNYFPIRRAANTTQYALGRTLLQEAYLIVDYERANFTLAQAIFPDPLPAARIIAITPPTRSGSRKPGPSTGTIAGIAIGSTALVALILALTILYCKRRNRKRYAGTPVAEQYSTLHLASEVAHGKVQEIGGTPLVELGAPQHPKTVFSVTNMLHELHAAPNTPVAPQWQGVGFPVRTSARYEMDGTGRAML
ncbi:acid protease [Dothidotthia symphoricarpi CBS 119687]|uniref:Acid protease n=1 Tax=Dothidotthia symphoricarpi CBS 119687 TaxID=1392245 RepID=A0A6A6AIQ8_9PLEO|nr:acid protease [Dothidotthia symphoricarpi CBS 119687]KAF2130985.1 acid protease [Dothidotthia symphoricarpi CBS 119687]